MESYINPDRKLWKELCLRPSSDSPVVRERVQAIIERVRRDGDRAIADLSAEIDGVALQGIEVSDEEMREAEDLVSGELKEAIERSAAHIRAFHSAQMPSTLKVETAPGVTCMQKPVAIGRVGLYIPGGTAPLFSTVLMLAIPAAVAGCREVVLCSPVSKETGRIAPAVLYAARVCGVHRIFKAGGAQAIAAMALGTESIPKVDKIFGPGNQYVTTAKQLLGGREVAIDMPAGPSEVMVIADGGADASFVAADLLSQAEHGRDSQVVLVCTSDAVAQEVKAEIARQAARLSRKELVDETLRQSVAVVFDSADDIVDFANLYAPEHLIISTRRPQEIAARITASGSVFLGDWSPESAGDYASGTNHTLPTCGWASSCSGVNIDSFLKKITFQSLTPEGLKGLSGTIVAMAQAEGLQAHANAVKVRMEKLK